MPSRSQVPPPANRWRPILGDAPWTPVLPSGCALKERTARQPKLAVEGMPVFLWPELRQGRAKEAPVECLCLVSEPLSLHRSSRTQGPVPSCASRICDFEVFRNWRRNLLGQKYGQEKRIDAGIDCMLEIEIQMYSDMIV
ncbi:Hypothetical protein NTJ_14063 [Nesidiocoris tenuis]|uniref:Uncharacterized protein n=1 Tax=Nesidiocoris tenuis TaxID=355587 RepID=A0ABN7BA33_9HEMI|nr:Hypothetical protein NTJ_14063 [Nesidiocoris tenuis]